MGNTSSGSRGLRVLLVGIVLLVAFGLRVWGGGPILTDEGVVLRDSDTLRRLVRLESADRNETYPFVEWRDGAPEGSRIHWTLPMDACIRTVNAVAMPFHPTLRGYEAGAVWVGPLLGTACVLALFLLLRPWLGFHVALGAAFLQASTLSAIASGTLGLADHQTLWLFAFAVATPAFSLVVERPTARHAPWLLGAALGLALWTSAEVTLVFAGFALIAVLTLFVSEASSRAALARRHLLWSLVTLAVCLIATVLENERAFAFRWDTISLFHAWPVAALALGFLATTLLARRERWNHALFVLAAFAGATLVLLLPFLVPTARAELLAQLEEIEAVGRWVRTAVFEFRPLFVAQGEFTLELAWTLLGVNLVLLPLALFVLPFAREHSRAGRLVLVALPLHFLALGGYEVKLLPLLATGMAVSGAIATGFALLFLERRVPALANRTVWIGSALALIYGALQVHHASSFVNDEKVRETPFDRLTRFLAERDDEGEPPIVLAPWGLSAQLLYETRCGVVASGYHRNLAGIRDAYAFWIEEDPEQAFALLERRKVDYVVTVARPLALLDAYDVLEHEPRRLRLLGMRSQVGRDGQRTEVPHLATEPALARTAFWRLAMTNGEEGASLRGRLRVVYESESRAEAAPNLPLIRVYAVEGRRATSSVREDG